MIFERFSPDVDGIIPKVRLPQHPENAPMINRFRYTGLQSVLPFAYQKIHPESLKALLHLNRLHLLRKRCMCFFFHLLLCLFLCNMYASFYFSRPPNILLIFYGMLSIAVRCIILYYVKTRIVASYRFTDLHHAAGFQLNFDFGFYPPCIVIY